MQAREMNDKRYEDGIECGILVIRRYSSPLYTTQNHSKLLKLAGIKSTLIE